MNPFATVRGDKSAMRPFAKLLWTRVSSCAVFYDIHLFDVELPSILCVVTTVL